MDSVVLAVSLVLVVHLAAVVVLARRYRTVRPNEALIVHGSAGTRVLRRGGVVLPVIQHAEVIDLGVKAIALDLRGRAGVVCRDNIRAEVGAVFEVEVGPADEDILEAVARFGCAGASTAEGLGAVFAPRFENALRSALREVDFDALIADREAACDRIAAAAGEAAYGVHLRGVALRRVDATPLEQLDPNNVFDAEGIRLQTERTTEANIRAHAARTRERLHAIEVAAQALDEPPR